MPVPASKDEFLDLVRKSGVIEDVRLNAYLQKLADSGIDVSDQPSKFASRLVRDGILTFFQAEQILQGKYKRFSIGKYKVLEKLGVGGMGQVFLCEHKMMKRRVAVKVLPVAKSDDDSARERFQREGQVAAALDHPNVVRAFDIDQDDNLHFLVMEYVEGINFHDLVKKHGVLDVARACHYIYGAAAGLEYARGMGIVHRDIKPGNILVDRGGVVKILDMGLARFFKDEEDHLTKKYDENVLGTADYLAPEQALDSHSVDTRADIYSLGGTFYYLLTGTAPFPDGNVAQKLLAHQVREPKPIQDIRPEVPQEVVDIVATMMAKKPEDRYQTPADLMAALAPLVRTPIPPPSDKEMPQLSRAAGGSMPSMVVRPSSGIGIMPAVLSQSSSGIPLLAFNAGSGSGMSSTSTSALIESPALAALWEDIAAETNSAGSDTQSAPTVEPKPNAKSKVKPDTQRPAQTPVPAVVVSEAEPVRSRKKLFLAAGIVSILATGALIATLANGGKPSGGGNASGGPPPVTGPRTLYVSKANPGPTPEVNFKTLNHALKAANAGDTILIVDDPHEEPPVRIVAATPGKLKDVTIDAGNAAKSVRFRLPEGAIQGKGHGLFEINGADGLKIRNLTLDVNDRLDYAVSITGPADGLTLENVTLQRPHSAGVHLDRAFGSPDRPIRIDHCGMISPNANCDGILIQATTKGAVNHVSISGCRFFGQGWNALHCIGPVSGIEFRSNRVFNFNSGVRLDGPDLSYQVKVTNSTFHTMTDAAIVLGVIPAETPKPEIVLELNHFAKTGTILRGLGPNPVKFPGLKAANNSRDKDSKNGNLDPRVTEMPFIIPPPITDEPRAFLKIEDDKLTITVDGKKLKTGARD